MRVISRSAAVGGFLAAILSRLSHGSDSAHGQSPALSEAFNRSSALFLQGRYSEAFSYAAKSLKLAEEEFGPDHTTTAYVLDQLAFFHEAQGNYAEAERLFWRSLAIVEKARGPEHPDVAQSFNNLAGLFQAQGNYAEAEPFFQRSLAIWETALGPK